MSLHSGMLSYSPVQMFAEPWLIFIPRLSAFDKSQWDAIFCNRVVSLWASKNSKRERENFFRSKFIKNNYHLNLYPLRASSWLSVLPMWVGACLSWGRILGWASRRFCWFYTVCFQLKLRLMVRWKMLCCPFCCLQGRNWLGKGRFYERQTS